MRTIKFRGIRIDNGEWVYGWYFESNNELKEPKIQDSKTSAIYKVIPKTVGQYTGLKDKNGIETYEGDIFKSQKSNAVGKINIGHYDDITSSQDGIIGVWFDVLSKKSPYGFKKAVLTKKNSKIIEVIGNIHQNGEL